MQEVQAQNLGAPNDQLVVADNIIRILLVEDNPADVFLIKETLRDPGKYIFHSVDRLSRASAFLRGETVDVILLDLSLPDGQGVETVARINSQVPEIPIVVLTGLDNEKTAVEALKSGAQDYIVKGQQEAAAFEQRIRYAIERKKKEESEAQQRQELVQQVILSAKQDVHRTDPRNIFFRCVEDCNEAMMVLDRVGRLIYVNPAWTKIYGYSAKEVLGRTLYFLQDSEDGQDALRETLDQARNPDINYFRGEVVQKTKSGGIITALLTIAPSRSPVGEVTGYVGIALDITAQRDLEAKVYRQEHLVSIGILASGLAHEIGTPLGVIRGNAEFLKIGASDARAVAEGLNVIISQIDRIAKLVESLLQLSRSTGGLELKPVDVLSTVREVSLLLHGNFKKWAIDLKTDIPENTVVLSDSHRLQQVFINLLVNSIHAIEEAIKTRGSEENSINIRAQRTAEKVIISITDTGCGIPPDIQKKMFQPFFTTKDIGKGTGLGLPLVYNLVQEMGGEIEVESIVQKFTTFRIILKSSEL